MLAPHLKPTDYRNGKMPRCYRSKFIIMAIRLNAFLSMACMHFRTRTVANLGCCFVADSAKSRLVTVHKKGRPYSVGKWSR